MTVETFQKIHEIKNTTPDTVERLGWMVCLVFGYTEEKVNSMHPFKFFRKVKQIERRLTAKPSRLFSVEIQTDASKITLGQFIECQAWLKGAEPEQAMDRVAASLLFKRKDHAEDAEYIRSCKVNNVLPKVVKFIESMNALIKSYSGLFETDEPEPEEDRQKEKVHPFIEQYGWFFSAKTVAEHEGIPLDRAYDLPIMQAFNDLAYLKAKQSYDKMKAKQ